MKVAGEFNCTVETGRDRQGENTSEYERGKKKEKVPPILLNLASKQPCRNRESKTTESKGKNKAKAPINQTNLHC